MVQRSIIVSLYQLITLRGEFSTILKILVSAFKWTSGHCDRRRYNRVRTVRLPTSIPILDPNPNQKNRCMQKTIRFCLRSRLPKITQAFRRSLLFLKYMYVKQLEQKNRRNKNEKWNHKAKKPTPCTHLCIQDNGPCVRLSRQTFHLLAPS